MKAPPLAAGQQNGNNQKKRTICRVEGCTVILAEQKAFNLRVGVCSTHMQADSVAIDGVPNRFCQKCFKFHILPMFDGMKRSCRSSLERHRERGRKKGQASKQKTSNTRSLQSKPKAPIQKRRASTQVALPGRARRKTRGKKEEEEEDDAPLASLAGRGTGSNGGGGSPSQNGKAGPNAPHPGNRIQAELGCAKCRYSKGGCIRCRPWVENHRFYAGMEGRPVTSAEEVQVGVAQVAQHGPQIEEEVTVERWPTDQQEPRHADSPDALAAATVASSAQKRAKSKRCTSGRRKRTPQVMDTGKAQAGEEAEAEAKGQLEAEVQLEHHGVAVEEQEEEGVVELPEVEVEQLAPLCRALLLPGGETMSVFLSRNTGLYFILRQHLRIPGSWAAFAHSLVKMVPAVQRVGKTSFRKKGPNVSALKQVRLPEAEEEWARVEAELQALMQPGNSPADALSDLRAFAEKNAALWPERPKKRGLASPASMAASAGEKSREKAAKYKPAPRAGGKRAKSSENEASEAQHAGANAVASFIQAQRETDQGPTGKGAQAVRHEPCADEVAEAVMLAEQYEAHAEGVKVVLAPVAQQEPTDADSPQVHVQMLVVPSPRKQAVRHEPCASEVAEAAMPAEQHEAHAEEVKVVLTPVAQQEPTGADNPQVHVQMSVVPSPRMQAVGSTRAPGRRRITPQKVDDGKAKAEATGKLEVKQMGRLWSALLLPGADSMSVLVDGSNGLHSTLQQHLRISGSAEAWARYLGEMVPEFRKWKPTIQGKQAIALKHARLPEAEMEWGRVEVELQALMLPGNSPADALSDLRGFAEKNARLWANRGLKSRGRKPSGKAAKAATALKAGPRRAEADGKQPATTSENGAPDVPYAGAVALASRNQAQRKRSMSAKGMESQMAEKLLREHLHPGKEAEEGGEEGERVAAAPQEEARRSKKAKKSQKPAVAAKEDEAGGSEGGVQVAPGTYGPGDRVPSKREDSKSCHDCMMQHIYVNCAHCESISYCNHCLKRYDWLGLTRADIEQQCPRCRGICICRMCLRRNGTYQNPDWAQEQLCEYATYMLGCLRGTLVPLLEAQVAEEKLAGETAQVSKLHAGERATCNRCLTSIPDLYRWCSGCENEFCLTCCQELRAGAPVGTMGGPRNAPEPAPGQPAPAAQLEPTPATMEATTSACAHCPNCEGAKLELRRFNPTPVDLMRDALPLLKSAAPDEGGRLAKDLCDWQQGSAVSNAALAGAMAPSSCDLPAEEVSFLEDPLDVILQKREGPWREAAFQPADSAPLRLFCPRKELLDISHPQRGKALQLFQRLWSRGEPIVVRGARTSKVPWTPDCMMRACREKNSKYGKDQAEDFEVINCEDWTSSVMTEASFFKGYEGKPVFAAKDKDTDVMLKVKDFPAHGHFRDRLKRHYVDFLEVLPFPEYTHPEAGPMNFAAILPAAAVVPDLGPKTYIAYGREQEQGEGDNVTKLHLDLSDAVNIMSHTHLKGGQPRGEPRVGAGVHAQPGASPAYGGAGCVWDIFRREDTPKLMRFMEDHRAEFSHPLYSVDEESGEFVSAEQRPLTEHDMDHVIHNQLFMLTRPHLATLKAEYGVEPWHFEQYQDDAVFIPAGCAHQVRNLHSCTKVAVDFVSPESLPQCLKLRNDFRTMRKEDKLQVQLQMMWGADWAIRQLLKAGRIDTSLIPHETLRRLEDTLREPEAAPSKGKRGGGAKKRKAGRPAAGRARRGQEESEEE